MFFKLGLLRCHQFTSFHLRSPEKIQKKAPVPNQEAAVARLKCCQKPCFFAMSHIWFKPCWEKVNRIDTRLECLQRGPSTSRLQKVGTIGAPILAADTPCSLRSRMPHLAKVRSHNWDPTIQSCRAYQPFPTRMEAEVSINSLRKSGLESCQGCSPYPACHSHNPCSRYSHRARIGGHSPSW